MKNEKKKDPAAVYYGQIEVPDECEDCAICGKPVRWPQEQAAGFINGQICHAECVEEVKKMEEKRPNKPLADWTAREQHEYCKARISAHGGECCGDNAKSCPLYSFCCQCPDEWSFESEKKIVEKLTGREKAILEAVFDSGAEEIGRSFQGSIWYLKNRNKAYPFDSFNMFSFILPGQSVKRSDIEGLR